MTFKQNHERTMASNRIQDILTTSGSFNKEINYWLEKLSGDLVKSCFPYDYSRGESYTPKKVAFRIEGEMFIQFTKICGGSELRLFGFLAASLCGLLYRYTGNQDILLAAPIYTQEIDIEFINAVLPLRIKIEEENSFKDIVYQVRDVINEASTHQNCPLEAIINMISAGGYLTLLETVILVANVHQRKYIDTLKPGMIFSFTPGTGSIEGEVEYNSSLYKEHTIEKIAAHFLCYIKESLVKKDAPIKDIVFLHPGEKSQLLYAFNDTESEYIRDKTIHELYEAQVERKPHCLAAVFENSQITYGELNRRSNQLARVLRKKMVNAGNHIVGIMVERCLEMIIGIFAILKAGDAYLPVEPGYPAERIKFMLEDSGIKLLLTQKPIQGNPGSLYEEIDLQDSNLYRGERENLRDITTTQPSTAANNLVYVIYTSGSTGKPKGVMIEHHSLVNRLTWMQKRYPLDERDTLLQKTPFTFDVSVWEMFWWSIRGAKLCFLIPGGEKDPKVLVDAIEKINVSVIHFVPSMLNLFIEYLEYSNEIHRLSGLKQVIASGEVLSLSLVKQFNRLFCKQNAPRLANLYGPTEATVDVSYFDCPPGEGDEIEKIPIGKPIDNIKLYIVDKYLHLQPIGVVGELCISGVGLARGYLNNPELTAEKFDHDLWDDQDKRKKAPGKIIYRSYRSNKSYIIYKTGDLARWQPDGNIEFIGRKDHQVKVRGYRIELGEIESCLLKHEALIEVVVVQKKDKIGDKFLCAYYVADHALESDSLKQFLAKDLPGYMVPSFFVQIEKIPLNSNGKLDPGALPHPIIKIEKLYVAPQNDIEKSLVKIWADILGIQEQGIGINDNFFELGGHSLKATVLMTKIHKTFDIRMKITDIFQLATVRALAEHIVNSNRSKFKSVEPVEKKEYYHLSPVQKRLYFIQQLDSLNLSYNIPRVIRLEGNLDVRRFESTLKKMVRRHETFRTYFQLIDDVPVQRIHDKPEFNIDYSAAPGNNGDYFVEEPFRQFAKPFYLSKAPLFRLELIKINEQNHILMFDVHHIIMDGTSMSIFINDFQALYNDKPLNDLKYQYKDYSEWKMSEEQRLVEKRQEEYWNIQFEKNPSALNLPTDFPRPDRQRFEGDAAGFRLNSSEMRMLKDIAFENNTTLYIVLLAIYNIFLAKLSGQEDIIVGISVAGRMNANYEQVIGMFVEALPIRNYPAGEKTFLEFLNEVNRVTLGAYDNQEFSIVSLIEKLDIQRDGGRNPLFDVMFVFDNMEPPQMDIPGIRMKPFNFRHDSAQMDLKLRGLEMTDGLGLTFEYSTSLFKKDTIIKFGMYYSEIAAKILHNPNIRLNDISISHGLISAKRKIIDEDFSV